MTDKSLAFFVLGLILAAGATLLAVEKPFEEPPRVGERWALYPNNPFEPHVVTILDIQYNHVLYQFSDSKAFHSETLSRFKRVYDKYDPNMYSEPKVEE
jgi:hypothetical protein